MATFNTAFGALPSVKTLSAQQPKLAVTGKRRTPGEESGDYTGNQQMQAQLRAQLGMDREQGGQTGGVAPTFADLQKQGRARPAPPPMQPAALPGAAAGTPTLLQELDQALQFTPQRPVLLGGMEGMTPGLPQTPTGKTPYTPTFGGLPQQPPQPPQVPQTPQAPQTPQVPPQVPQAPQAPQAPTGATPSAPTGYTPANVPTPVLRPEGDVPRIRPSQPLPPPVPQPVAPVPPAMAEIPPLDEGGDRVTGSPTQISVGTTGAPQAPPPYPTLTPYTPQPVQPPTIAPTDITSLVEGLRATLTPQQIAQQRAASGQAMAGPVVTPNTQFLDMLQQQLASLAAGPASQEQQAFEAQRRARQADLEAQFGAQRSQLEDELAARGLYASSIGAGRFGDLAGQQARAVASMEAEILNRQAELAAERQRTLISGLQGAAGVQADIDFRAAEIQQQERLRGREMDINEAQMLAQQEFQRGQLRQGYAEIQSRERLAQAEINMRAAELQQQERLKGRELDLQSARDIAANELGYQELRSREDIARLEREAERDIAARERELRFALGQMTNQGTRGEFLLKLIDMIGTSNIPPDVLAKLLQDAGLPLDIFSKSPTSGTPGTPGTPPGDDVDPTKPDGSPETWPNGSYIGQRRTSWDGIQYQWSGSGWQQV